MKCSTTKALLPRLTFPSCLCSAINMPFCLINSTGFSGLCISSYHSENLKSLLQISNSSHLISNVAMGDYKKFCNLKTVSLRCNQCCTLTKCWEEPTERNAESYYTLVEIHITISHRSCVSFCLHHLTSINVEIIQYEPGCISIEWETG